MFDDLLAANRAYQATFDQHDLVGVAARGLAVLTCIDSRIEPLSMLGIGPGDAKILRNAGARVSDDALRSLVLSANYLGANRICVVQHTDCAMTRRTEEAIQVDLAQRHGADTSGWDFATIGDDQIGVLRQDLARLRACPLIGDDVVIGGFLYDVHTGGLDLVVPPDQVGS